MFFNCLIVGYMLWHELVLLFRRYWPGVKAWLRKWLWDHFKTRWNCLEDEPVPSWWSKRCKKDPDAKSLGDKIRELMCAARAAPAKKKKKKKKKVKKKKFNLVERYIPPSDDEEEEVVE